MFVVVFVVAGVCFNARVHYGVKFASYAYTGYCHFEL